MRHQISSAIATYLTAFLIAFAPLPFGSTTNGPIGFEALVLGIVLAIKLGGDFQRRDVKFLLASAVVAVCWLAIAILQLLPNGGPQPWLTYPVWQDARRLLPSDIDGYVTAVRHQPILSAGAEILCFASLIGGYLVGRQASSARLLLASFAMSGLLYAAYAIISAVLAPNYVLWLEKTAYQNVLTGTFINANTAATYFGSCSLAWLLYLHENVRRYVSLRLALGQPSRRSVFCLAAFFITLTATFMTGSRAGSSLTLLVICGAVATFYWRDLKTWSATVTAGVAAIAAISVIFLLLGGRVNDRFDAGGLTDEGRLNAYASTLKIIRDFPWLGTGLGTFRWVFPAYRSDSTSMIGVWDRAHNTTLELASEMGIPFLVLIILGWLTIFAVLWRGMANRKRDQILPIFAFWAGSLSILHSQLDFSLQIPGFALVILTLTGAGLAQSSSSRPPQSGKPTAGLGDKITIKYRN